MNSLITIIEILQELCPGVDFDECSTLVDDRIIDSLTMIALVTELEDIFEVTIPPAEVTAANFNSIVSIQSLIDRLSEGEED